jgi:hypothetical protein
MVCDRLRTQTSPTAASSLPRHAYAFEGVHTTRADPSGRSHPARCAIRAESQPVAAVRIRSHSFAFEHGDSAWVTLRMSVGHLR